MPRLACLLLAIALTSAGEPIVIGETTAIESQVLGEERTLMIHLPDGYAESPAAYPVLYLLGSADTFHGEDTRSRRDPCRVGARCPNKTLMPPAIGPIVGA